MHKSVGNWFAFKSRSDAVCRGLSTTGVSAMITLVEVTLVTIVDQLQCKS